MNSGMRKRDQSGFDRGGHRMPGVCPWIGWGGAGGGSIRGARASECLSIVVQPAASCLLRACGAPVRAFDRGLDEAIALLPSGLRPSVSGVARGGKRSRPALVWSWHAASGGRSDAWVAPAVAVELIHRASLIHDDLPCMDDARERNGAPCLHVRRGAAAAVLAGDSMIALAFRVLAASASPGESVCILADTVALMCDGQADDLSAEHADHRGAVAASDGHWADVCQRKTGGLFAAAGQLGVIAAGSADEPALARAERFGLELGILYQQLDDLIDLDRPLASAGEIEERWARLQGLADAALVPAAIDRFTRLLRGAVPDLAIA
jgi:geranylgeranyl diphosphate synthase type II